MISLTLILFTTSLILFFRNPIHCLLCLILAFLNFSILLFHLNMEFLALSYVVIYVGAISVLFLFVILLLNLRVYTRQNYQLNILVIFLFFSLVIAFLSSMIIAPTLDISSEWVSPYSLFDHSRDLFLLGKSFFFLHFHYFLFVSLLLLLGIISVITISLSLTKKKESFYRKIGNFLFREEIEKRK